MAISQFWLGSRSKTHGQYECRIKPASLNNSNISTLCTECDTWVCSGLAEVVRKKSVEYTQSSVLSIWPWCCVLHSVMRFWQRQKPCCELLNRYPPKALTIFLKMFLTGRWLALANGDVSCMAIWCLRRKCLHLWVLGILTDWVISENAYSRAISTVLDSYLYFYIFLGTIITTYHSQHHKTIVTLHTNRKQLTLVIHADAAGMKADVVLIFKAFILSDAEQNGIFHLQPELAMFVFQCGFILLL